MMVHQGGGEGIACADRVRHRHAKSRVLNRALLAHQQAAATAAGDAHQPGSGPAQKRLGRGPLTGKCGPEQAAHNRQFVVIQLDDAGQRQGLGQHYLGIERWPQIDVKNSQRFRPSGPQELLDGLAARGRTLRQRPEADRISPLGQLLPLGSPLQKIPGHGPGNLELRLAGYIYLHLHRAGGMIGIALQVFGGGTQPAQPGESLPPQLVIAHAAGYNAAFAEQVGKVGEIGRRSSQLTAAGQQVPENLAQPDYGVPLPFHKAARALPTMSRHVSSRSPAKASAMATFRMTTTNQKGSAMSIWPGAQGMAGWTLPLASGHLAGSSTGQEAMSCSRAETLGRAP